MLGLIYNKDVRFIAVFILLALFTLSPFPVQAVAIARVTVEDQINEQQTSYKSALSKYSSANQQKLTNLSTQIAEVNKKHTLELDRFLITQGQILDEYQRREDDPARIQTQLEYHTPRDQLANDGVEKARYWLTYAHEAVAYQAARQYILNLHGENAIKSDGRNLVNQLKADLKGLTQKVVNAEISVKKVIDEK